MSVSGQFVERRCPCFQFNHLPVPVISPKGQLEIGCAMSHPGAKLTSSLPQRVVPMSKKFGRVQGQLDTKRSFLMTSRHPVAPREMVLLTVDNIWPLRFLKSGDSPYSVHPLFCLAHDPFMGPRAQ